VRRQIGTGPIRDCRAVDGGDDRTASRGGDTLGVRAGLAAIAQNVHLREARRVGLGLGDLFERECRRHRHDHDRAGGGGTARRGALGVAVSPCRHEHRHGDRHAEHGGRYRRVGDAEWDSRAQAQSPHPAMFAACVSPNGAPRPMCGGRIELGRGAQRCEIHAGMSHCLKPRHHRVVVRSFLRGTERALSRRSWLGRLLNPHEAVTARQLRARGTESWTGAVREPNRVSAALAAGTRYQG
jgi:hypothetical protein